MTEEDVELTAAQRAEPPRHPALDLPHAEIRQVRRSRSRIIAPVSSPLELTSTRSGATSPRAVANAASAAHTARRA